MAEERAELSIVQFMKCAHGHADLTTGPNAQCNRRAQVVALRQPRRRVQGCFAAECRQRARGPRIRYRLPVAKAAAQLLQPEDVEGEQCTGERAPHDAGGGQPAWSDRGLPAVGLLAPGQGGGSCPLPAARLPLGLVLLPANDERGHRKAPDRRVRRGQRVDRRRDQTGGERRVPDRFPETRLGPGKETQAEPREAAPQGAVDEKRKEPHRHFPVSFRFVDRISCRPSRSSGSISPDSTRWLTRAALSPANKRFTRAPTIPLRTSASSIAGR